MYLGLPRILVACNLGIKFVFDVGLALVMLLARLELGSASPKDLGCQERGLGHMRRVGLLEGW